MRWLSLLLVALAVAGCGEVADTRDPDVIENERIMEALNPGDTVTITNERVPGQAQDPSLWVYASREAIGAALKAAAAKDEVGGSLAPHFSAESGTQARVLDADWRSNVVQVRLLTGSKANQSGWVPVSQIKP